MKYEEADLLQRVENMIQAIDSGPVNILTLTEYLRALLITLRDYAKAKGS